MKLHVYAIFGIEFMQKLKEILIPYLGTKKESRLLRLAEEAGGARLAENVIQMTEQDLERFLYFIKEGY